MKKILALLLTVLSVSAFAKGGLTQADVIKAQNAWGKGIVTIGEVFQNGGDYVAAAEKHIKTHYDYQAGPVLFKPTLASITPFRNTFESALSYFVGGDSRWSEDTGFAIKPWTNVRFDNHQILTFGDRAIAMGHYYFTTLAGDEVKVEYTLGFVKRGKVVKIFLQDSSLPYQP